VLLVEDEPLVAQTVRAILRRGGHNVHHIADGAEAWKHLAGDFSQYDLLVVDVNLPGLNGIDLVGRARAGHFAGRILVVSGRVGISDLRALVQLHVDRVLTKPFTAQQFEGALSECLS
jgi:DNA-binding response OmpR family regulator